MKEFLKWLFKLNVCDIYGKRSIRKKLCKLCDKAISNMAQQIAVKEDKRILEKLKKMSELLKGE